MNSSGMTDRGFREMGGLRRILPVSLVVLAVLAFIFPSAGMLYLVLAVFLLLLPLLLYGLDRLEQLYPGLEKWFNPFDGFRKDTRGQLSILGLLAGFLMIVVYFSLIPTINAVIDEHISELGTVEASLVRLIHLVFIVAILGSIFIYARQE